MQASLSRVVVVAGVATVLLAGCTSTSGGMTEAERSSIISSISAAQESLSSARAPYPGTEVTEAKVGEPLVVCFPAKVWCATMMVQSVESTGPVTNHRDMALFTNNPNDEMFAVKLRVRTDKGKAPGPLGNMVELVGADGGQVGRGSIGVVPEYLPKGEEKTVVFRFAVPSGGTPAAVRFKNGAAPADIPTWTIPG